ncbi:hypothetical protein BC829DRAFT_156690 [Chytridium lagenaria]|nr:hypothetical protein BC829DRAFT_156690 [Chytridium lagenaria]
MEVDHILHPVDGFEPVDSDHEDGDAYEDIVAERNQLRQDNDRLWQIIERQRAIIHELKLQLASVSEQTVAGTLELPTPSEDPKSVSPGVSIPSVSSFVPLQIPAAATPRISLDFSTLSVTDFTGSAQTGSSSLSHPESSLSAIEASPLGIRGSATPIEDQVANADADLEDEAEVPTSDGEDSAAGPTRAVRRREAQRRKLKEEDKRSKERDILLARKREAETSSQKFEAIGNPPASVLLSKSAAAGSQKTVSAHSRSSSLGYTEPKPGMAGGAAGQPHSSGSLTRHKRSASQDAHNPLPPDIVITTRSTSITELHAAAPANVGIVSTLPEAPLGGAEPDMPDLPSPAPPTPPIKMINSSRNNAETPLPLSHTNRNMSLSSPTLNGADANPQGVAAGSVTPTKSPQTVSHSNYVEHALPTPPQQLHRSHVPHVGVEPQRGPGGTPPPPSYPHNHPVPSLTSSSPPPPGSNAMNPPHNPNHAQQPYPGGYIGQSVSNQHLPFPPASHPHPHGFASHQPQQQQPTQPRSASPTSIQRQMSLRGVPGSPSSPTSPTLPSIPPGDLTLLSSQITSSGTTPSGGSVVPMIATTEGLQVQVLSSAILTGDAKNKEVVSFQFQVRRNLAGQGQQQAPGSTECWRIEKVYSDVVSLDAKLRSTLPKTILSKVGKPPEKSLYSTLNPAKSDQRKVALEMYLQRVVDVVTDSRDVIEFLTTNVNGVIGRSDSMTLEIEGKPTGSSSKVLKEGVLVKKGKSFGGWKTRYFKLKQTALEYYDASGREIISTIKLRHCLAMSEKVMTLSHTIHLLSSSTSRAPSL